MSSKPWTHLVIVATLMLFGLGPLLAETPEDATTQAGRELTRLFLDGKTDALWARFTPKMQAMFKNKKALADFRVQVEELGTEEALVSEQTKTVDGRLYIRIARWSNVESPVAIVWGLDAEGKVTGLFVKPVAEPAPSAHLDRETKAALRLPFEGDWYVVWGGRTLEQNYHAVSREQRFAYDFLKQADGRTYRTDGKKLEDYLCWNEKILAPAAGRVVAAVDGLPDQAIGTTNSEQPVGNHVVLDLGQGEFAFLAHLRKGSVRVAKGDTVAAGDELGRCGNSGNTSEPHLHFHLQSTEIFANGEGLPAFFNDYEADGKPVRRGEPVQGQAVRRATPPS
jgi:hypothetical protein